MFQNLRKQSQNVYRQSRLIVGPISSQYWWSCCPLKVENAVVHCSHGHNNRSKSCKIHSRTLEKDSKGKKGESIASKWRTWVATLYQRRAKYLVVKLLIIVTSAVCHIRPLKCFINIGSRWAEPEVPGHIDQLPRAVCIGIVRFPLLSYFLPTISCIINNSKSSCPSVNWKHRKTYAKFQEN